MSVDSAHKSPWAIAEVIFGIPFLISLAIHFLVPWSFPPGSLKQILSLVGIALIIIGVALIVAGRREFTRFGQPTDPGHPTSKIIQTGVFSISRNPLYLACVLVLLGLALTLNLLWACLALLLSIILCLYVLILPEERYLAVKFGEEYKAYTASVNRWFGRR